MIQNPDSPRKPIVILMAEDDEDDRLLAREAFREARLLNSLRFVQDGVELMEYLLHRGPYQNPQDSPRPDLILMDLNMPRMDGREALDKIKSHPDLRQIPVVVLTTSQSEADIIRSYNSGANSFITKPVSFDGIVDTVKTLKQYWFEIVDLPQAL